MSISNDQFVVPHIYVDDDTGLLSQNLSEYDLLINSGGSSGSDGILGLNRHASTFIYTMVNLDAGEFTIWAANKDSNNQSLVAVDMNNVIVDQASLCPTSPQNSPSSGETTTPKSSDLSGGAIAGIAVGAVAAVSLLGLLGWWILRRKRKESQLQPEAQTQPTQELHHVPGDNTDKFLVPGGMTSTGRNTLVSDFDASGTARTVSTTASHQVGSNPHASELPALHHQQGSRFELHG